MKIKITAKQITDAIEAVISVAMPFARLVMILAIVIIMLGILLGVVLPAFSFGTLQTTFDTLVNQTLNFTVAGFGFVISGGEIALTLLVLAVVFIVFSGIISSKSDKGKGKSM